MTMHTSENDSKWRATTILAVRKNDKIVLIGDGQVSLGNTVMKGNARKVRQLIPGKVLSGFAGATADAFTLFEFSAKYDPVPTMLLIELGESSVNIAVRPWVKRDDYGAVRSDLLENIKRALEHAGLSIPYPQRGLHIVSGDLEGAS